MAQVTTVNPAKLLAGIVGCIASAGVFYDLTVNRKMFGGTRREDILSFSPQHIEATELRMLSWEREGSPDKPIVMNPIRRHIPARIRNKDDLPELSE